MWTFDVSLCSPKRQWKGIVIPHMFGYMDFIVAIFICRAQFPRHKSILEQLGQRVRAGSQTHYCVFSLFYRISLDSKVSSCSLLEAIPFPNNNMSSTNKSGGLQSWFMCNDPNGIFEGTTGIDWKTVLRQVHKVVGTHKSVNWPHEERTFKKSKNFPNTISTICTLAKKCEVRVCVHQLKCIWSQKCFCNFINNSKFLLVLFFVIILLSKLICAKYIECNLQ